MMARRKIETAGRETWGVATALWTAELGTFLERFRMAYQAELARFAEAIRPQLQSGEMGDYGSGGEPEAFDRLEEAVAEHFGLVDGEVARGTAEMIRLVSASAQEDDGWGSGGNTCKDAAWAVALDLVKGWVRTRRAA